MKIALAIFAKTAELSAVKTRLASDIGDEKANAFYALSVKAIETVSKAVMQENENIHPHWSIGEEVGTTYPQWQSFPAIWTGGGGLGERLASISKKLFETHDAVIFIGTDSPQISPQILLEAGSLLKENSHSHIAGPALDGGFYLFGSNRPVPRNIWEAVQYSSDTTLEDLSNRLQKTDVHIHQLVPEQDVDTIHDLISLRDTLTNKKPELLPAQVELLNWLKEQKV